MTPVCTSQSGETKDNPISAKSGPRTSSPMFLVECANDTPFYASKTEKQRLYDAQWPQLQPKSPPGISTTMVKIVSGKSEKDQSENSSGNDLQDKPGPCEECKPLVTKNTPSQTSTDRELMDSRSAIAQNVGKLQQMPAKVTSKTATIVPSETTVFPGGPDLSTPTMEYTRHGQAGHVMVDKDSLLESEINPCPSPSYFSEHGASAQIENDCLQSAQNSGLKPVQSVQSFSESVYASLGFELERKSTRTVCIDSPAQQQANVSKTEDICMTVSTHLQCNSSSGFASHEFPKTAQNCHCASPELALRNYLPTDSSVRLSGSVQDRNKCTADRNSKQLEREATGHQLSNAKSGQRACNSAWPSAPTTYLHSCTKPERRPNGCKRCARGQQISGKCTANEELQRQNEGSLLIKQISTNSNAGSSNKPNTATSSYSNPASLNNPPNCKCSNSHFSSSPVPASKHTRTVKFHGQHGWTPLQMEIDSMSSTTIPLRLYRHHFRHRPLHTVMEDPLSPGVIGFFVGCAKINKSKIVFLAFSSKMTNPYRSWVQNFCPTSSPLRK